jgi:hypothetical protein
MHRPRPRDPADRERREGAARLQNALVISKATGKDFNAVLTATSKAQDGSTTSLARYGIMLPKVTTAQDALKASNDHATKPSSRTPRP